jgi:FdrA protein
MATEDNLRLLKAGGLLLPESENAGSNDLLVAASGDSEEALAAALAEAERTLAAAQGATAGADATAPRPRRLDSALRLLPGANLALLSLPGQYVRAEGLKALKRGLNLFIFSDGVAVQDEVFLKQTAAGQGLLVMGPECGTSIIHGVALGFANVIRPGKIGLVGAAGTGLQEVSTLIDRAGEGISHAIGTGGRDTKEEVGALTTLQGFQALEDDPATEVIVVVSKPPAPAVAERVAERARRARKPCVLCFIGQACPPPEGDLQFADCLESAAIQAVSILQGRRTTQSCQGDVRERTLALSRRVWAALAPGRKFVRGLFSGGSLCYEAQFTMRRQVPAVFSNAPLVADGKLPEPGRSFQNTLWDLGSDEFTRGRPHPMIDSTLRREWITREANDPQTALLLLDVVLGYGANPDPTASLMEALLYARRRQIPVAASICGTEADPQIYSKQQQALEEMGVLLFPSNAEAARFAGSLAGRLGGTPE